MNTLSRAYEYAVAHSTELGVAIQQHAWLVLIPLAFGIGVGLPLGLWSARSRAASVTLINFFNALRVIPSLAILFLMIPYL